MTEEQRSPAPPPPPESRQALGERTRQWLLATGTVLALVGTVLGFLMDSLGLVEYVQQLGAPPTPTPALSQPTPQQLAVLLTPSPTLPPTATPTPTPLPVIAGENEQLLLVAQFANYGGAAGFNVAGRISEALEGQIQAARLEDTRVAIWPDSIDTPRAAAEVVARTRAAMMIWGEYDSGRVRVRFVLPEGGAEVDWQRLLSGPDELSTTINLDVPRETQALTLMALGRLYRDAGDLARARAAFAQALAQRPSDTNTVATLTFYLAFLDATANPPALDAAIAGYSSAIEIQPDWVNARYNRGLAYLQRFWADANPADLDAAAEDFTWTLGVRPTYVEALVNRGIVYFTRAAPDDFGLALGDFREALRLDARAYRALYNRGLTYIRLDQRAEWEQDLLAALAIAPDFWLIDHALCWGYALDNDPADALPHCDKAAAHDPTGSVLDARGLILAELGRLDEAAADLRRYIGWLETQSPVWQERNGHDLYMQIIAGLEVGENPITPEILAQLR